MPGSLLDCRSQPVCRDICTAECLTTGLRYVYSTCASRSQRSRLATDSSTPVLCPCDDTTMARLRDMQPRKPTVLLGAHLPNSPRRRWTSKPNPFAEFGFPATVSKFRLAGSWACPCVTRCQVKGDAPADFAVSCPPRVFSCSLLQSAPSFSFLSFMCRPSKWQCCKA